MEIIEELQKMFGSSILTEREEMLPFRTDASHYIGEEPLAVAIPADTKEVSRFLAFCNDREICVVSRGGGTSLTGSSIPLKNYIVLSLGKMNRLIHVSTADRIAIAEPGLRLDELNEKLSEAGFFYPPDPASSMAATVGGSISTNAGGLRASLYGTTKEWVLGLEVVLPDGSVMQTGGKVLKRSAGYDITAMMIGAEGTLGVITKAYLKILPKPKAVGRILAYFDSIDKIGKCIVQLKTNGVTPLIAEFLDRITMDALHEAKGMDFPKNASYMLIFDVASSQESIVSDLNYAASIARSMNPISLEITQDPERMARIYEARKGAYSSLLKVKSTPTEKVIIGDVVVLVSELPAALTEVREKADQMGIRVALFGHISDGNIHANIFADASGHDGETKEELFQKELAAIALKHSGSVSAEHGIGIEKKELLLQQLRYTESTAALEIMRQIKHAFDPKNIMNRGKIFD